VTDLEEMRRKREEDTLKCGRVLRSVRNQESRNHVAKNKENALDDPNCEEDVSCQVPFASSLPSSKFSSRNEAHNELCKGQSVGFCSNSFYI